VYSNSRAQGLASDRLGNQSLALESRLRVLIDSLQSIGNEVKAMGFRTISLNDETPVTGNGITSNGNGQNGIPHSMGGDMGRNQRQGRARKYQRKGQPTVTTTQSSPSRESPLFQEEDGVGAAGGSQVNGDDDDGEYVPSQGTGINGPQKGQKMTEEQLDKICSSRALQRGKNDGTMRDTLERLAVAFGQFSQVYRKNLNETDETNNGRLPPPTVVTEPANRIDNQSEEETETETEPGLPLFALARVLAGASGQIGQIVQSMFQNRNG
jgi:hypothetical protein